MKRCAFVFTVTLTLCFLMNWPSGAESVYITDEFKVTLRTGPSTENKIIAMLPSGQSVTVLDSNGEWSHVRLSRPEQEDQEGWVLSRYLITRLPWKLQAESLKKENIRLKEELPQSKKNLNEVLEQKDRLTSELKNKTQAFDTLQKEYELLKKNAAGYLELKKIYDEARSTLENTQKQVKKLAAENESLRYSERNRWFITGASVLFCGFIIGVLTGRSRKKSKPSFY